MRQASKRLLTLVMSQSVVHLKFSKPGCHLETAAILKQCPLKHGQDGILHLSSQTLGVAVSLNENADPTVRPDLQLAFDKISQENPLICASLMGYTLTVPITSGRPSLGTWQGLYVANFTGCKEASLVATFLPGQHVTSVTVTAPERGCHIITDTLAEAIPKSQGVSFFHLKHTSAALCLGSKATATGPLLESTLNRLVPESWNDKYFTHTYEGPDDMPGHVKSSLIGTDLVVPIVASGELGLGADQVVYLVEPRNSGGWGGGHRRSISRTVLSEKLFTSQTQMDHPVSDQSIDVTPCILDTISTLDNGLVNVLVQDSAAALVLADPNQAELLTSTLKSSTLDELPIQGLLGSSIVLAIYQGRLQLPDRCKLLVLASTGSKCRLCITLMSSDV
eukprot:m.158940 g.158940  ORF g.158940 m.158940 type:complete len:393 (-) comp16477_c1_seq5:193-1371(-)